MHVFVVFSVNVTDSHCDWEKSGKKRRIFCVGKLGV